MSASHHSKCSYAHQVIYVLVDTLVQWVTLLIFLLYRWGNQGLERPKDSCEYRRLPAGGWPPAVGTAYCPRLGPDPDGHDVIYYLDMFTFIMYIFILNKLCILHLLCISYIRYLFLYLCKFRFILNFFYLFITYFIT